MKHEVTRMSPRTAARNHPSHHIYGPDKNRHAYAREGLSRKGRKRSDSSRAREGSRRQCQYVQGIFAGKTKRQAALDAGYSRATADNARQKIESSPAVRVLFKEILERAGITDAVLAQRIGQGLDATIVVRGEHVVDFGERRRMVELACRLLGYL